MPPNSQQPPSGQPGMQPQTYAPPAPIAGMAPEPQPQPNMAPMGAPMPTQPGQPPQPNSQAEQQEKAKQASNQTTAQKSLLFSELRDGMIIMSDGSFRAVVSCESINFDLMSGREREGVEYSYQNFLNSLFFPVQILVRSQRVDIAPYLERLDSIRRSQDNMLLNVLMEDYLDFVDALAENANIMEKTFYIVIPYSPEGDAAKLVEQSKGFFSRIFGASGPTVTKIDEQTYTKAKDELNNRVESVVSGLFQVGVQATRLNTKQLGELYYNMYNPDTAVRQPLGNFENYTSTHVQKGQGAAPQPNLDPGVQ